MAELFQISAACGFLLENGTRFEILLRAVNMNIAQNEQVKQQAGAIDSPPATKGVVARAVAWKGLSTLVGQACWYGSLLVLARLVPPQDFGVIAVGVTIINLVTTLLDSGTGGPLIIARELDARSVRRSVIRLATVGIALSLLLAALAGPITDRFAKGSDPGALQALAPIATLISLWIVPNALLQRSLSFGRIAIVYVIAAGTASIAAVVAAALGASLLALIIRLFVFQLVLTVLTWLAAISTFPTASREVAPVARRPGAIAFLTIQAAVLIAWSGGTLVVAANMDTTQVGLYSIAFSLAYLPLTQISWTIGTVLFPAVAATRDLDTVRHQMLKALRLMTLLLLPLLPVAITLAPSLIPALLGQKWIGAVAPFQILVVVGVGQGIANVLGEVFSGVGGETLNRRARIDLLWGLGTLAAIAAGVRLAGIQGAAIAHVLTFSGLAAAYVWYGSRALQMPFTHIIGELRWIGVSVFVQAVVTFATATAIDALSGNALSADLIGAALGGIALLFALVVLQPNILKEIRTLLSAVMGRQSL
jgi:O-antigen/teichoic acid export membrane protein